VFITIPFRLVSTCSVLVALGLLATAQLPESISTSTSVIQANSNREPAGKLEKGVLTLRLEVRQGDWYPEADTGPSMKVYAFAEEGKPLQVPAPLIRVPEGTEIRVSVHNFLSTAAVVHGMHRRPGNIDDVLKVPAGEAQELQFTAGPVGTYQYWATVGGDLFRGRPYKEDSQLAGAFLVDPPSAVVDDRVFVIGFWQTRPGDDSAHNVAVINGKSWPYTERLTYEAGKPVR
jgi:FtsP/CotA-like multicopper oxidase with cupredoxin domain